MICLWASGCALDQPPSGRSLPYTRNEGLQYKELRLGKIKATAAIINKAIFQRSNIEPLKIVGNAIEDAAAIASDKVIDPVEDFRTNQIGGYTIKMDGGASSTLDEFWVGVTIHW